ncbi:hypothetical protein ACFXTO_014701 [Malus domestica]
MSPNTHDQPLNLLAMARKILKVHRNMALNKLKNDLIEVMQLVDNETKHRDRLTQAIKSSMAENWWERPADEIETDKLDILITWLEELRRKTNDMLESKGLLPKNNTI